MKVYLVTHWVVDSDTGYPIDVYQNVDKARSAVESIALSEYNNYIKIQEKFYNYEKDTKYEDFAVWDGNTLEMGDANQSIVIDEFELK